MTVCCIPRLLCASSGCVCWSEWLISTSSTAYIVAEPWKLSLPSWSEPQSSRFLVTSIFSTRVPPRSLAQVFGLFKPNWFQTTVCFFCGSLQPRFSIRIFKNRWKFIWWFPSAIIRLKHQNVPKLLEFCAICAWNIPFLEHPSVCLTTDTTFRTFQFDKKGCLFFLYAGYTGLPQDIRMWW